MAFLQTTAASISSGGTITGDIIIEGDLTVQGGGSLSFDEIIEGTQVIDVDSIEAFLVRKDGDGGDILTLDTTNSLMKLGKNGGTPAGLNIYGATNGNPLLIYEDTDNSIVLNFYLDSSDNAGLGLYANGASQKVNLGTVSSSPTYFTGGDFGIGTSSPVAKLDIVGTRTLNLTNTISDDTNKNAVITHSQYDSGTETEGFMLMQGFSNSSLNRVDIGGGNSQHNAVEEIRFFTAANATTATGTERMIINSDGTTTFHYDPTISSYNGNLTVKSANTSDGDATLILISDAGAANEDTWKINADGGDNDLDFINHTNTRMTLTSAGKVGIGYDSPANSLSVSGVITSGNATGVGVGGTPSDSNTSEIGAGYINLGRDDTASAKQITFGKNGAVHSYIETTTSGLNIGGANVGIGATSPYSPLHVKSSAEGSVGGLEGTDGTFIPQVVIEGSGTTAAKMSPTLALFNSSTGADGDTLGSIMFMGGDDGTQPPTTPANATVYAGILAKITDETNSSNDGELHFLATKGNDNTNTAMSIVGSDVTITGTTTITGALIDLRASADTDSEIIFREGSTAKAMIFNDASANSLSLSDGSGNLSPVLNINSGSVGIGTASPSYKLDIQNAGLVEARVKATSSGRARLRLDSHTDISEIYFAIGGTSASAIYQAADGNSLNVYSFANSSDVMRWDLANNRVGIGTSSPASALNIEGTDNTSSKITITNTSGTDNTWSIHANYNTQALTFTGDSTEVMTLLDNGNVGIGVSPHGTHSDYDALYLGAKGMLTATASAGSDNVLYIGNNVHRDTDDSLEYIHGDEASMYAQQNGVHTFYVASSGSAGDNISFTTVAKLDTNSRISLSNNGGTETTVFGYQALNSGIGGSDVRYSVAIGHRALMTEDSTDACTAIGYNALASQNQTGVTGNTGVGYQSIFNNVTGTKNTALGYRALKGTDSQSGSNITAIGYESLAVAYGQGNTALGQRSGVALTSGVRNVLIGVDAGATATTSSNMVLVGTFAGDAINNTGADGTVAIGRDSLTALTSGDGNVALGFESAKSMTTGARNVVIGYQAGDAMTIATRSVAIGYGALGTEDVGDRSIAIGFNSLFSQNSDSNNETTGNIGIGVEAGFYNQTGQYNTLIGSGSGQGASGQNHSQNTAVGYASLNVVTTGGSNVAMGMSALRALTSGSENVSIGKDSMYDANTASGVVAVGTESAYNITSGSESVAIGKQALYTATTVGGNTAVGYQALKLNTAAGNTAIGHSALLNNSSGINVAVGYQSGTTITTGTQNTLVGYQAGQNINEGGRNTAVGHLAFGGSLSAHGDESFDNTFIGFGSGSGDWSGASAVSNKNTAVGAYTMQGAMDGSLNNVAMGYSSLKDLTTGDDNVAVGIQSLENLTSGSRNVALGYFAMAQSIDTNDTIAIGRYAMGAGDVANDGQIAIGRNALAELTSGTGNVAIGYEANANITTASWNTVIGYKALASGTASANNNTAIGFEAGRYLGDDGSSNHSSFNTIIGRSAMGGGNTSTPANNTAHLNIAIGHGSLGGGTGTGTSLTASGNTAIGYASMNVATSAANNVTLGYGTLQALTSGERNIAIGNLTLDAITTQSDNIAIGQSAQSAQAHANSTRNIAIGQYAMENMNAWQTDNIAIGYEAMEGGTTHADIDYNIAIGSYALDDIGNNGVGGCVAVGYNTLSAVNHANSYGAIAIGMSAGQAITQAQRMTAVGYQALAAEDAGSYQTAVGYQALAQVNNDNGHNTALGQRAGYAITTGSANTLIGSGAEASANSGVNQTVIGQGVTGQGNNTVTLGNADVTDVVMSTDYDAIVHCGGVRFPDTQVASADANQLDDYEEGTWSPIFAQSDSLSNAVPMHAETAGNYTKIGNVVHVTGQAIGNSSSGSVAASDTITIKGLPFAVPNDQKNRSVATVLALTVNLSSGKRISGYVLQNTSQINLYVNDGTSEGQLRFDELTNAGHLIFQATYLI